MFRRSLAVVVALGLLAACGGGGKKAASTTTTTTALVTTTTAPPQLYPLTGLPATDPSKLTRPALVVKIDNADGSGSAARPQFGLNQADVVYEEMVEGSVTRLAAVFHSDDSDPVGPVRSARTTDIAVFTPLNKPLYAWSGANVDFAAIIRSSNLIDVGYDAAPDAYFRRNETGHVAPHNLYSSTPALFGLAPPDAVPPSPLFVYRATGEALNASASPLGSMNIAFGGGAGSAPVDWTWDAASGSYLRDQKGTPDVDEAGVQIGAQNVVIEFVGYHNTGYVDPSGSPVPEGDLVGTGECWILTNGMMIQGTWTKASDDSITTYTDGAGAPIKLTPGRTWVELPPIGGATVTG